MAFVFLSSVSPSFAQSNDSGSGGMGFSIEFGGNRSPSINLNGGNSGPGRSSGSSWGNENRIERSINDRYSSDSGRDRSSSGVGGGGSGLGEGPGSARELSRGSEGPRERSGLSSSRERSQGGHTRSLERLNNLRTLRSEFESDEFCEISAVGTDARDASFIAELDRSYQPVKDAFVEGLEGGATSFSDIILEARSAVLDFANRNQSSVMAARHAERMAKLERLLNTIVAVLHDPVAHEVMMELYPDSYRDIETTRREFAKNLFESAYEVSEAYEVFGDIFANASTPEKISLIGQLLAYSAGGGAVAGGASKFAIPGVKGAARPTMPNAPVGWITADATALAKPKGSWASKHLRSKPKC